MNRFLLEQGKISHNPRLGVFTAVGTGGSAHAVKLFPRESCTCPSTKQCYHILAAKMSIGMEDVQSRRRVNLTQLRRNARQRPKRSGRKAPRPDDYEITSAPDAVRHFWCNNSD